MTDVEYMLRAVELAKRGTGTVNPNPLVGAVIVRDDEIIAEGWHERYGELHAERNAIKHYYEKNETGSLKGATIYVTLEPCCHHGKQPPCVDAIIENGFARVVIGSDDPNPLVAGIGTVLADDPELTCRLNASSVDNRKSQTNADANSYINIRNPIRIICDTNLRMPLDSKLVKSSKEVRTILATAITDIEKHEPYIQNGCEILVTPLEDGHIDLKYLMKKLGEMNIDSILLEGGGTLNFAALKSGIVNRVQAYIAPKIFGGIRAKTPVEGAGILEVADCVKLSEPTLTMLDGDILIESEVSK